MRIGWRIAWFIACLLGWCSQALAAPMLDAPALDYSQDGVNYQSFDAIVGRSKIGAYYDTSAAADLANPAVFDIGRQGLYLLAAQQIYKWGPDQRSGLALFGIFTASDQNTAKFKHYYEAGSAARGVFPGRELDILSLGWVRTDMGGANAPRTVQQGADTVTWVATDAPRDLTGQFLRDRNVILW